MKKVAVIQSSYIPWKGYFDIINDADLFIFHDNIQYTKSDWRNRNKIKTQQGLRWLTIPVGAHDDRLICEIKLNDNSWRKRHLRILEQHYSKAKYFSVFASFLHELYIEQHWDTLSELNQFLVKKIAREFLGVATAFEDSRSCGVCGKGSGRLISLLKEYGATTYISGPTARNYIDESLFEQAGIELIYKDYSGYPEHPQFHPPFVHQVTILDLLFHTGPDAPYYIWGWRAAATPGRGA